MVMMSIMKQELLLVAAVVTIVVYLIHVRLITKLVFPLTLEIAFHFVRVAAIAQPVQTIVTTHIQSKGSGATLATVQSVELENILSVKTTQRIIRLVMTVIAVGQELILKVKRAVFALPECK